MAELSEKLRTWHNWADMLHRGNVPDDMLHDKLSDEAKALEEELEQHRAMQGAVMAARSFVSEAIKKAKREAYGQCRAICQGNTAAEGVAEIDALIAALDVDHD